MDTGLSARVSQGLKSDSENGISFVERNIFTDPEIFDLEIEALFENNWVYLAHESQVPKSNDFFSTFMGRQPVVLTRAKDGSLNAFINACSHRGATVCRQKKGNSRTFTCPFHGWTFKNTGELLKVKGHEEGAYSPDFDAAVKDNTFNLTPVAKLESYRGFVFASLNENVPSLSEHLGDSKTFIDILVDQSPDGVEVLKGSSTYTFNGNWKLQAENGADGYHVATTHWNYVATIARRAKIESGGDPIGAMDFVSTFGTGGFYTFPRGHVLMWAQWDDPENRPIYSQAKRLQQDHGELKADWMVTKLRNLCLYPNVFLMDQASTQIRVIRPLAVDKTEVTIYCFAPKGENAEDRAHRLRQYEDFFNASGLATPDDLTEFEQSQLGFMGQRANRSDISRGAEKRVNGPDEHAKALDINPAMSGTQVDNEGIFLGQHGYWLHALQQTLKKREAS